MKKIPTLFKREFEGHQLVAISPEVAPGLQWVLDGKGVATEKYDGVCCAIIDGIFYKRYDAKRDKHGYSKLPPEGAIPCCDPDPVTGHWPHWVVVKDNDPSNKWFIAASHNLLDNQYKPIKDFDGTYEAIGPHFQSNPYHLASDILVPHGKKVIDLRNRSFEGIRIYLEQNAIEGIVFWKDGEPRCKIKRRDFGFEWPVHKK